MGGEYLAVLSQLVITTMGVEVTYVLMQWQRVLPRVPWNPLRKTSCEAKISVYQKSTYCVLI